MTISIKPTASGSKIEQDGSTVLSVESDRSVDIDSGTLHVDATNNRVGINTSSPASSLHIDQGSGGEGLRFERDTYDTVDIELSESGLRFRNETDGRTDLFLDGSGNFKFNSGYGSVATAYGCRAWVNFNGTGTVAIRASGNVNVFVPATAGADMVISPLVEPTSLIDDIFSLLYSFPIC